jgi:oligopeptide transport system substrate-binding protein
MSRKKLGFLIVLVAAFTVLLAACGGGSPSQNQAADKGKAASSPKVVSSPAGEKIFRMNVGKYSTLDPQQCNDVGCALFVDEIYSGLLTLTIVPKEKYHNYVQERGLPMLSGKIMEQMPRLWQEWAGASYMKKFDSMAIVLAPDIAKEIPEPVLNADGTVSYTFNLRENVKFHNGKPMTAHDFKFSFERAASPNWPDRASAFTIPTADLYLADIVGVRDRMFKKEGVDEVRGVEALDDYTLRITIDAPKPYFLWKLTYPTSFVIDKDKIINPLTGKVQDGDWTDPPNGTGPFSAIPGTEETVLVANKNFYLGRPLLDKVIFNHEGGQSTIFPYDAGKIDITGVGVDYLPRTNPKSNKYDPEFARQYISGASLDIFYVVLNTQKPPFDDKKVRQAFAMAVNSQDLAIIGEGLYIPAEGILPPGVAGYDPDFRGIPYDPEGAKALLRESRYWGTDKLSKVEFLRGGTGPQVGAGIELILDSWKKNLGIEIVIDEPAAGGVYQNRMNGGDYQITVSGWILDYPDPEDVLDLKLFCNFMVDPQTGKNRCERDYANNQARYNNPEFDKLLIEARTEQDPKRRVELYRQAHEIVVNDAPWIPLVHTKNSIAVKPWVLGYYPASMVIPIFRFIDIKK